MYNASGITTGNVHLEIMMKLLISVEKRYHLTTSVIYTDHLERQEEIRKKKESEMERFKVEMKLHKYSRCALYPQETEFDFEIDEQTSVIIRSPVPDNKVLFSVSNLR